MHPSDEQAHAAERADAAAGMLETLVASHRELLGFVAARVGDRAQAEDILQQAFVKSIDKLDGVREQDSVLAWFYRVLRRAIIDHLRASGAESRRLERVAQELGDDETPSETTEGAICQCVKRLAETLKPEYREALLRIDIEGVAVKDFAAAHGLSASNAGVRVFRARRALRGEVTRACGTCAEHGCMDCTCGH